MIFINLIPKSSNSFNCVWRFLFDCSNFSGCKAARFDCSEIDFSGWTLLVNVLGVWIDGAKPNFIWPMVSPEIDVTLNEEINSVRHVTSFWTYLYHPLICGNPNPKVKRDISIHPNSLSYSMVSEFWKSEFEEIFCDWEYFKKMLKMSFPGSGSARRQFFWKPKLPDDVQLVETVPSSVS